MSGEAEVTVRVVALITVAFGLLWDSPASATVYSLRWTGAVNEVQGGLPGSDIQIGDTISASFTIDASQPGASTMLPLGGGFYSIYNDVPVSGFAFSIGSYATNFSSDGVSLTYVDDSFGMDGIVLGLNGLSGGPFGSTFADIQFQASGPPSAIDGSGTGNGLPYGLLIPRFFAVFGDGTNEERVFGDLTVWEDVVPEPGAWALMIGGLGLAGAALRARRGEQLA
jgi:hypothetical protein